MSAGTPVPPAFLAVIRASETNRSAPRALFADPLRQPDGGDHGRGRRRGDDRQQRIEALHAGVAAAGALLGVAVGLLERVVDIDVRRDQPVPLTVGWPVGVARYKLADHWRRRAREDHGLRAVADTAGATVEDPWDERLDALRAHAVLAELAAHPGAALTLRYLDDLPVPEVAACLDRSLHETEALLVRARTAFRRAYTDEEGS